MGYKETFIQDLLQLPEGLDEFLDTQIGNFTPITIPRDTDDAVIAMGNANAQIVNNLLVPFSGMKLIELIMRIGQFHSGVISLLLANMEYVGPAGGEWGLEFIEPVNGNTYLDTSETEPVFFSVQVDQAEFLDSLTVTVDDENGESTSVSMAASDDYPDGDVYIGQTTLPITPVTITPWTIGYTATAEASYRHEDTTETKTASVTFSITNDEGQSS